MHPIEFPQQTAKLAKSQPQYRPLPVAISFASQTDLKWRRYTCKYELSPLELAQIAATGTIWLSQTGYGFNPILPQVETPYGVLIVQYKKVDKGLYDFWVPLTNEEGEFVHHITDAAPKGFIDWMLNNFPDITAENLYFEEKPALVIAEGGII